MKSQMSRRNKSTSMPEILPPSGVRVANHRDFIRSFRSDYFALKASIVKYIYDIIKSSIAKGTNSVRVWNVNKIDGNKRLPRSNMKPSTFFTGTWDPEKRSHCTCLFDEANLPLMLDAVVDTFKEKGYTVKDVSDKGLSNSMVLLVEWGEEEDGSDCLGELGA